MPDSQGTISVRTLHRLDTVQVRLATRTMMEQSAKEYWGCTGESRSARGHCRSWGGREAHSTQVSQWCDRRAMSTAESDVREVLKVLLVERIQPSGSTCCLPVEWSKVQRESGGSGGYIS